MQILDGRLVAGEWQTNLAKTIAGYKTAGFVPGLAVLLVGNDPASVLYTTMKEKTARTLGFYSTKVHLPETATENELLQTIAAWNANPEIHGILIQLPLPKHLDSTTILEAISPQKDVDGLHPHNLGRLLMGHPTRIPATVKGILKLLEHYQIPTEGKHVVVVGRSTILGKPLAAMFLHSYATVTVCHSKTTDLARYTRQADIIVMDTGVPNLLTADMVRSGVVVIDAGISKRGDGSITGDVDFSAVSPLCQAITPVPGGVGPMTIAALLANTLESAEQHRSD